MHQIGSRFHWKLWKNIVSFLFSYFNKIKYYELESTLKPKKVEPYKQNCFGIFCQKENQSISLPFKKLINSKRLIDLYWMKGKDKQMQSSIVDSYANEVKLSIFHPLISTVFVQYTLLRDEVVKVCNHCYLTYKTVSYTHLTLPTKRIV